MPKEILFPGKIKVSSTGNCFVSSLSTIIALSAPDHRLNPQIALEAMPNTNDIEITNLLHLLAEADLSPIKHDILEIPNKKTLLFQLLTAALGGGAVCEISVYGKLWLKEVLREDAGWVSRGELHSVVVYGCYQPIDDKNQGWFYIADSYCGHQIFVDLDTFFDTICVYVNDVIRMNIFNLCQDPTNLVEKFGVKSNFLDDKIQKRILGRLFGKSERTKLNKVIRPKRSASRHQN